MKVLVTGGSGFLGRHIVAALKQRGDQVRILCRRPDHTLTAHGVECISGAVENLNDFCTACQDQDAVIHTASRTGVDHQTSCYEQVNIEGTRNAITACQKTGTRYLIYTSTPSVVFGTKGISGGDESLPYPPSHLGHYARTKAIAEICILQHNRPGKFETIALRPHLIWGPGDTSLLPRLVSRARAGKLRLVGSGENLISISYVSDVAQAHLDALDALTAGKPVAGKAYFINDPTPVACWQFLEKILAIFNCQINFKRLSCRQAYWYGAVIEKAYACLAPHKEPPLSRFLALQLALDHWFRPERAMRELAWIPRVTIEEGLEQVRLHRQSFINSG